MYYIFYLLSIEGYVGITFVHLILLAVSSIYDILVVATRHRVNKYKTALTRETSARAKKCVRAKINT